MAGPASTPASLTAARSWVWPILVARAVRKPTQKPEISTAAAPAIRVLLCQSIMMEPPHPGRRFGPPEFCS
ncbi:MAG: hypothetical protein WDN06_03475 [Asticcacaulis sp.]